MKIEIFANEKLHYRGDVALIPRIGETVYLSRSIESNTSILGKVEDVVWQFPIDIDEFAIGIYVKQVERKSWHQAA